MLQITNKTSNSGKVYQVTNNNTAYHSETPLKLISVLEDLIQTRQRVKIYTGDVKTGICWNEEYDTIGHIGRSTGDFKIPLLVYNSRSYGGGALLDHCILKIRDIKTGRILYQADNFIPPVLEIMPTDMPDKGFTHNLIINGDIYSRHRSERAAKLLYAKMK